jgi:hypothetical protein
VSDNVEKHPWGFEAVWANADGYGAKHMMFLQAGSKTDIFFQKKTHKTWFVASGNFSIKWIDTSNGKVFESKLEEGSVFEVETLKPVCLEALADNSSITEVNNGIYDNDKFIVYPSNNVGI